MRERNDYRMREITRGDDKYIDLQVISVIEESESVNSISGCDFTYTVKEEVESPTPIYQVGIGYGIEITDADTAFIRITISGSATNDWELRDYRADLQMVTADGDRETIRKETLRVLSDITR